MENQEKKKVLIFIVAYNAENHIVSVLNRIPRHFFEKYEYEILIIDDHSKDKTFEHAAEYKSIHHDINLHILYNPINQRYGGNQKLGYHYAINHGFDYVVLLHGDGQYAPELVEDMILPLQNEGADCVMGSRMIHRQDALKGGMPYYKYLGNIILTKIENYILKSNLKEFHSGYRAYSVEALKRIPFEQNSNDFNFDTQIIIQLLLSKMKIVEIPIPTYYGDEICHVDGLQYGVDIIKDCIDSRLHGMNIFYKKQYDVTTAEPVYDLKLGYKSSHTMAIDAVTPGATVLDIGCGTGLIAQELKKKNCHVIGVDMYPQEDNRAFDHYYVINLNHINFNQIKEKYSEIIMLDIIEHLNSPEDFLQHLREESGIDAPRIIMTTPNIAFIIVRLQLLLGQFNYGKKGILDMTHTRLFTFSSLKKMLIQQGYTVHKLQGIPAPFPKALGENFIGNTLLSINNFLIQWSRTLFSYQIYVEVSPTPVVKNMLEFTTQTSIQKHQDLSTY